MAWETVQLDDSVFERIETRRHEDETFSEALDRLTSDYSLLGFVGGYTDEDAARHRSLLRRSTDAVGEDHRDGASRLDGEDSPY